MTRKSLHENGFRGRIVVVHKPMLERYFYADKASPSDIFIVCDDDIMLAAPNTLDNLVDILRRHPEYSQMGLSWGRNINFAENSWFKGCIDDEVWEADHVGGCVAIRKGTIKDLGYKCDYPNGFGDDKVVAKIARELGHKVGIARNEWFYHLGYKSTVWESSSNK